MCNGCMNMNVIKSDAKVCWQCDSLVEASTWQKERRLTSCPECKGHRERCNMLVQCLPQRTFDTLLLSSCIKTTLRASASGVRASWLLFISFMSTLSHTQVSGSAQASLRDINRHAA